MLQAGDGFIQRFAPCFVGAGFAVAQFFGDDVGEFERFVVGFAAVARQHGFEVDDFGFAFTQDGGAAGIVDGDEDVARFDLVAFFDVQFGEDAGVEALDDLQAAAGDDGSLPARDFFKFVVVGPDDESGEEGGEEEDAPPQAAMFFFLQGGAEIADEFQVFLRQFLFFSKCHVRLRCFLVCRGRQ